MDDDWTAILRLRGDGLGARRIQGELRLHADRQLSLATIHKVLKAARVKPLVKAHRPTRSKRYSRSIPGECVQMDTMKVVPGVYQYTAIDDCSRFRVLGVYPRRSGRNTLLFLDRVVEEMPFPIQRMQTDRGTEFFAEVVQKRLQQECIKFRPIPPRSPHLNGKVERSQLTDLIEFWSRHSPQVPDIAQRIEEWQFDYNWRRSHGSLSGRTPVEAIAVPDHLMPMREDVSRAYEPSRERIRFSNWKIDQAMAALHRDLSKPKANSDAS
jgi:transposase InsO family protein